MKTHIYYNTKRLKYVALWSLIMLACMFQVKAQISLVSTGGTLTANYTNLSGAIAAINAGTHTGTIIMQVHTSFTEPTACSLNASGTGSASYVTVILRPADTAITNKTITYSTSATTFLTLNGADSVTIDGRPLGLGSSKLLTLTHSATTASSHTLALTGGANSNTFRYCTITNAVVGTTAASAVRILTGPNANNTFYYANITGGNFGIEMNGTNVTPNQNTTIQGCQISNQKATAIILSAGAGNMIIDSNNVFHTIASTTGGYQILNVGFIDPASTVNFTRNRVYNINMSAANFTQGIFLTFTANSGSINIRNNSMVLGSSALPSTATQIIRCVLFQSAFSANVVVENNTFRIGGTHVTGNGQPTSVCIQKTNSSTGSSFTMRNNLCINTRIGASGFVHAASLVSTPTTGINIIDYNTYIGTYANVTNIYASFWNGTPYGSITAYRAAATPSEQHSTFGVVDFLDNVNPDVSTTSANNTGAKLVGIPNSVATDIYGNTKNATAPFRGAFEGPQSLATTNDIQTLVVYTYGKIPIGTTDTIRAIVRNQGSAAAVNVPLYLHSSLNGLIGSVMLNMSGGDEQTVKLLPYTPTVLGYDTLRVFPQPDQLAANDTFLWVRENTLNALSYARPFQGPSSVVGTTGYGELAAKFYTPVPNFVNQVNVTFGGTVGVSFQVVIYPDSGGLLGPKKTPIYVSAPQQTVSGTFNLSLPAVPVSDYFYMVIRQTSTSNVGFSYQTEAPMRTNTMYFRQDATSMANVLTAAWNDFAPNNPFRFMIEPRLQINNDLGVIDLTSPGPGCIGGINQAITAKVQNLGLLNQDFSVNPLTLRGTATNPSNVITNLGPLVINTGTLNSNALMDVNLSTTYDLSAAGNYTFKLWTEFGLDNNYTNDTLPSLIRSVYTVNPSPYTETFNSSLTLPAQYISSRFTVSAAAGNASNGIRAEVLNLPGLTIASITTPRITGITASMVCKFDYRITDAATGLATTLLNTDSIRVLVTTDCGATFTTVMAFAGASHPASTGFRSLIIPLGAFAGSDVKVMIQADFFGSTNDANVDIDNIKVYDNSNDISMTRIDVPCRAVVRGGAPFVPAFTISNTGTAAQSSIPVNIQITGPVAYSSSTSIAGPVASSSAQSGSFSTSFNPITAGTYTAKAWTSLSTDADRTNDTITYVFTVVNVDLGDSARNGMSFGGSGFLQVQSPASSSLNLGGSALTVETWLSAGATGAVKTIVSRDSTATFGQYSLTLDLANFVVFSVHTANGRVTVSSATAITPQVWTHVAGVYDGTTLMIYINGKVDAVSNQTGNIVQRGSTFYIGQQFNAASRLTGILDELKVWNVARDASQIRSGMHVRMGNAPSANLVGYWRFDESGVTSATDASGNCNSGLLSGTVPTFVSSADIPLGSPAMNSQIIFSGGFYSFTGTGLDILINGFTGTGDTIIVNKFAKPASGVSPVTTPGGVTAATKIYWIVYRFGDGSSFTSDFTFALAPGSLTSGVVPTDVSLFRRNNTAVTGWNLGSSGAASTDFATQKVTFSTPTTNWYNQQLVIGANNNPLPVELLSFTGDRAGNDVRLSWMTANEQNSSFFSIERSADNKEFSAVGRVEAAGNSNVLDVYEYMDVNAIKDAAAGKIKTLYYRLRQFDFDGSYTLSSSVAVDLSGKIKATSASVEPNPFKDVFTVKLDVPSDKEASIVIMDMAGRTVADKKVNVKSGSNTIVLDDMQNKQDGMYIVHIQYGEEKMIHKIMKASE